MMKQRQPNEKLRYERERRGWSQKRVADLIDTSKEIIGLWERGERGTGKKYQERLCELFGKSAEELGFIEGTRKPETPSTVDPFPLVPPAQNNELQGILPHITRAVTKGIMGAVQELGSQDLDKVRRLLLKVALGLAAEEALPHEHMPFVMNQSASVFPLSELVIAEMKDLALQYRHSQRIGAPLHESMLRGYAAFIQYVLENTIEDQYRRELWRILSLTQILLRHHSNGKDEVAKAKTWNEAAISSAQRSNDSLLVGGTIGHLAHLYLMRQNDMLRAHQLLESAEPFIDNHAALKGWFAIIKATIASKSGNKQSCTYWLSKATDFAFSMPQMPEYADSIFTEFDAASVDSWSGYCLLNVEEPSMAYERLLKIQLYSLSERRQADHYQDIAKACFLTGEHDLAEKYAFQSIDKAKTTRRTDVISRSITFAGEMEKLDAHSSHATKIVAYAQKALEEVKGENI